MMSQKILFLDETAEIGGAEINLINLASGLKKIGWNPEVILPNEGVLFQRLTHLGISVYSVSGVPTQSVSAYLWGQFKVPNPLAWAVDFTRVSNGCSNCEINFVNLDLMQYRQ